MPPSLGFLALIAAKIPQREMRQHQVRVQVDRTLHRATRHFAVAELLRDHGVQVMRGRVDFVRSDPALAVMTRLMQAAFIRQFTRHRFGISGGRGRRDAAAREATGYAARCGMLAGKAGAGAGEGPAASGRDLRYRITPGKFSVAKLENSACEHSLGLTASQP